MSGILKLESLTKGNTLKQGDKTPLKYKLFDADGEKLNIAGKSAKVRLAYPDFLTIGYEKDGLTVAQDDTVTFTIDKVIPAKLYHVEIIVDDKFIFPSRADESKFTVDKSSLGTEANIIEVVGIDAVVLKAVDLINDDPSLIIDEDKLVNDIISNTGIGNINEYYQAFNDLKPKAEQSISRSLEALSKSQNALNVANGIDAKATNALSLSESADTLSKSVQEQFNQVIIDGDSSVEAAQARVDASGQTNPTLKARLDKEHNEVTAQLAQTEQEVAKSVQSIAMPENISTVKTKSPKLVITGSANDRMNIVQWNGTHYILYGLDSREGTSNVSVGGNWDLIRLNKAIMANDVYVAKTQFDESSVVGTLGTTYESELRNTIENYSVYTHPDEVQADFLSSSGDGKGVAVRRISGSSPSQVSWDVQIGTNRKCNMLLFSTTTSSTDVDILVNGEVVVNLDTTKFAIGTNLTYRVVEFEIPTRVNISTSVKVTLRNNDTSGAYAQFSCLNYMKLKDYDGRDIDFYKVFTTSRKWIDHAGSSDYAIFDKDLQQWCGSYHGGETRVSAQMTWASGSSWQPTVAWDTGRYTMRNKADIPVGWYITPQLKLRQLTNINNKGRMLSIFDFDTDGTLQMNFSFFDGSIVAETFYTALTTTHVSFNMVEYPRYENIPTNGSNVYLRNSEGYVIQRNSANGLSLGNRFTLFGDRYIPNKLKTAGWIYNDANYYKKLYYGYADGYADGVLIESLQFRKSLDFMSS